VSRALVFEGGVLILKDDSGRNANQLNQDGALVVSVTNYTLENAKSIAVLKGKRLRIVVEIIDDPKTFEGVAGTEPAAEETDE
jgi:hypothetical protein